MLYMYACHLGLSALGFLVRSKNKQEVNPFPEGMEFWKQVIGCVATKIKISAQNLQRP